MSGSKYSDIYKQSVNEVFSTIDFAKSYHQILINSHDIGKTALTMKFPHMTFGLYSTGLIYQRSGLKINDQLSAF